MSNLSSCSGGSRDCPNDKPCTNQEFNLGLVVTSSRLLFSICLFYSSGRFTVYEQRASRKFVGVIDASYNSSFPQLSPWLQQISGFLRSKTIVTSVIHQLRIQRLRNLTIQLFSSTRFSSAKWTDKRYRQ